MRKIKYFLLAFMLGVASSASGAAYAAEKSAFINYTVESEETDVSEEASEEASEGESEEVTEAVTEAPTEEEIVDTTIDQYDTKKAIAMARLMYVDDQNNESVVRQGCGFFIGDGEKNVYFLTTFSSVCLTEGEKEYIASLAGLDKSKLKFKIEIILKNDLTFEADLVNSSETKYLAILKPKGELSAEATLRLSEDTNPNLNGATVYSYYAGVPNETIDTELKSVKNVKQVKGTIDEWNVNGDAHVYKYYTTNIVTRGMPLLDENGKVVGINVDIPDANETGISYALQIYEAIDILKLLGIDYNPEIKLDEKALDEQIAAYQELKEDKYTELSWKLYTDSYNKAVALKADIVAGNIDYFTQDKINEATADLIKTHDELVEAGMSFKTLLLISIITWSVSFVIIVFLIILLIVKCRKYKRMLRETKDEKLTAEEALKLSGRVTPGSVKNNMSGNMPINRSLAEASQGISSGEPETSVLSAYGAPNGGFIVETSSNFPSLVRMKTGESIVINKNNFIIGTSSDSVDYYVRYNNSISRQHACIMRMQDGYYVRDLDSSNGTFVNGNRIAKGSSVRIFTGCVVGLAEEGFEFKE